MKNETMTKLDEIITILKSKPTIEMVCNIKELGPCEIGIAYPNYPGWVYEVESLFQPIKNYLDVINNIKKQKKCVSKYTLIEVRAALTYFIRWERFCDGHMASMIENGYLLRWLKRYKNLIQKEA